MPFKILNRRFRTTQRNHFWKDTECRMFMLYFGHIVLKYLLDDVYYRHCVVFNMSMLLLLNPFSSETEIRYAGEILIYVVNEARNIYGKVIVIYNFHLLTHIADDALKHKNMYNCFAFIFENSLGKLKSMLSHGNKPLQQLICRLEERSNISSLPKDNKTSYRKGNVFIINNEFSYEIISYNEYFKNELIKIL